MTNFASTAERAVGILAALQRLTGDFSTGSVTVVADSTDVVVPKNATLFPVLPASVGGVAQVDYTSPFRTMAATTVTSGGTSVPIASWLGGQRMNLVAGTKLIWWPSVAGVGAQPTVDALMTGGTDLESECALKSVSWWEEPTNPEQLGDDFLRAAIRTSPGAVLGWSGTPRYVPRGNLARERVDRWQLVVAVTAQQSHHVRGLQGLAILDLCEALLANRATVAGGAVISARGITVTGRSRIRVSMAGVYAYGLTFETQCTVTGLVSSDVDHEGADWLRTQWLFPTLTDETGTHPGVINVAGPIVEPMP